MSSCDLETPIARAFVAFVIAIAAGCGTPRSSALGASGGTSGAASGGRGAGSGGTAAGGGSGAIGGGSGGGAAVASGGAGVSPGSGGAAGATGSMTDATLVFDDPMHDFGPVVVNQSAADATFAVTNRGDAPTGALTVGLTGASQGFAVKTDECGGHPLGAGESCRLVVSLTPTMASSLEASLTVTGMPGGTATATLTGTALAPGALTLMPTGADFPSTAPGMTSAAQTFTVKNTGASAAGTSSALAATLAGNDPGDFVITANDCMRASTLAAGATCTVAVAFRPMSSGKKAGSLRVNASPGGTTAAALGGTAPAPAALALAAAGGSSTDFGTVNVGDAATKKFTVTNGGEQSSGAITVTLTTPAGSGFSVAAPAAGDCTSGTTTLAPGASCTITVRFSPTVAGGMAATLAASATPGGSPSPLALAGTGAGMALLALMGDSPKLGTVEVGTAATGSVTFTNGGSIATGAPMLSSNSAELAVVTNGCMAALAPGSSCMISFRFTPSTAGQRIATVMLSAMPGGAASASISATGAYRLTVARAGTGSGTVTSVPAGISCGTTCSALFTGMVTLQARTTNGSSSFVSDLSGGGCSGPARDCQVDLSKSVTATVTFSPMSHNLVFVSSMAFSSDLGSAMAYDAKCNTIASAAGINNSAGNGYVAATSDARSTLIGRLGSARGWVRMDGQPFGDTIASMLQYGTSVVFNPVGFNETGAPDNDGYQTGTSGDGTANPAMYNCSDFTTTSADVAVTQMQGGTSTGGGRSWISSWGSACGSAPILCMGKTQTSAVSPAVTQGKKIWMTNARYLVGGGMTPDQTCQAQRPAGVTTAQALIATTTRTAASVLSPSATYVRPDGSLVGTGSAIAASRLFSGIWQSADGVYRQTYNFERVWTGANDLNTVGSPADTCKNWTDPNGTDAVAGWYDSTDAWWSWATLPCNASGDTDSAVLYCVQTAP